MNEFTPEQEKRIGELIEQREKRAGLLGWLFGVLPSSVFALLLLPAHFHEIDETLRSWKDTVEDAPVVFDYAGRLAYNAYELAEHGQLPLKREGDINLITIYSNGTNTASYPVSGIRIGTAFVGITAGPEIWHVSGDGTIKATKRPLT